VDAVVDDPDTAPGTVVRVVRPGYGDAERQLRPVAVAVARPRE
jgi:molecular chaperone GrpE